MHTIQLFAWLWKIVRRARTIDIETFWFGQMNTD